MALTTMVLDCPQCGAPVDPGIKKCSYCHSVIMIKRIGDIQTCGALETNRYIKAYQNFLSQNKGESVEVFTALGICHLKNKTYDRAIDNLSKAINLLPENGDPYYYYAIAKMKGKRPYLQTLSTVKEVVNSLETAIEIEPCGRYFYLLYLLQVDFYDKKRLRNKKSADELQQQAISCEIDEEEVMYLHDACGLR